MNFSHNNNSQMSLIQFGLALASLLLGLSITFFAYLYYGTVKYGSGFENYSGYYVLCSAIAFFVIGAPAYKTAMTMLPYDSNLKHLRIITMYFLSGFMATGLMIIMFFLEAT